MNAHATLMKGQARTIEDAVEAWKADYDEAMHVRDLEAILAFAIQVEALLRQGQANLWTGLLAGEIKNPPAIGETGRAAYAKVVVAFSVLASATKDAVAHGYEVEKAEAFAVAQARLIELQQEFDRDWPAPDPAVWERSRKEFAAGQFRSVREMLRERRSVRTQDDPG